MKFLTDLLPVLLFFIAYKFYGIYPATIVAIVASVVQVGISWIKNARVETIHIVTMVLILVLGGATLTFHNDLFIKWKPSVINWVFALAFLGSQWIGTKPLTQRMLENNVKLPAIIWQRLNTSWVVFFTLLGFANLYVIYHFDTDTWVNFKLFGMMGLTLLFVLGQALYMANHIETEKK